MKLRALLLVVILLLAILPAATSAADAEETRSPDTVRVKLYVQLSLTAASLSTTRSSTGYRPATILDIPSLELEETLIVQTTEMGIGLNKGFESSIGIQAIQAGEVTVEVLDEDNAIARRTISIPSGETRWDWRLPLLDNADTYTFLRGHVITLRIEGASNLVIKTNSNSYLELWCQDHLKLTLETRDLEGRRASSFYPNDLVDQRHVVVEGDIKNPFGVDDVAGVNISIRRPDSQYVVENQAATVGDDLNYTYDWSYNTGLPAGRYTINATGRDLQGHEFSTAGTFIMAEYGIRVSAEGEEAGVVEKDTTPGKPAPYTLTVLNIGGKSAQVLMDEGSPISLWKTSFSKTSFTLSAGADDDITFDVQPASELRGGNVSEYIVTATVTNDPSIPKAKDTIKVITTVRDDIALDILPKSPDPKTVGVGGTVDHTFTIRNIGEFTTSVDLIKSASPEGWTVELRGPRVTSNAIEDLDPMEIVDVTLRVTAPSKSTVKKATIKVTCRSREQPEVSEDITFVTNMVIGLVLKTVTPTSITTDPDRSPVIYFDALNNDPTASHTITFSVEQRDSSWPSSSFMFTPNSVVSIPGDGQEEMGITINVPSNAEANKPLMFTVRGVVDGNSEVSARFSFNVTVNVRHQLVATLNPQKPKVTIVTDEDAFVYLTVRNNGNVREKVNVTLDLSSDVVEVRMNDALMTAIFNMDIDPGTEEEIKIAFRAKAEARHKEEITVRVFVKARSDPATITPDPGDFKLVVEKSADEQLFEFFSWAGILILLLVGMGIVLFIKPGRRRSRGDEDKGGKEEKEPKMGTMVRQ